jgi:antitoxin YefM
MKAVRNAEYLAEIDKAAAQFEAGKGQIHDLIEVEDDE